MLEMLAYLQIIPQEIFAHHIFPYLDAASFCALSMACWDLHRIARAHTFAFCLKQLSETQRRQFVLKFASKITAEDLIRRPIIAALLCGFRDLLTQYICKIIKEAFKNRQNELFTAIMSGASYSWYNNMGYIDWTGNITYDRMNDCDVAYREQKWIWPMIGCKIYPISKRQKAFDQAIIGAILGNDIYIFQEILKTRENGARYLIENKFYLIFNNIFPGEIADLLCLNTKKYGGVYKQYSLLEWWHNSTFLRMWKNKTIDMHNDKQYKDSFDKYMVELYDAELLFLAIKNYGSILLNAKIIEYAQSNGLWQDSYYTRWTDEIMEHFESQIMHVEYETEIIRKYIAENIATLRYLIMTPVQSICCNGKCEFKINLAAKIAELIVLESKKLII